MKKISTGNLFPQIIKEGFADAAENALLAVVGVVTEAQFIPGHNQLVGFGIKDFKFDAHRGGGNCPWGIVDGNGVLVAFLHFLAIGELFGAVGGAGFSGGIALFDIGIIMPFQQFRLDVDVPSFVGISRRKYGGFVRRD